MKLKKLISAILSLAMLTPAMAAMANVNEFPPKRPDVGVMMVDATYNDTVGLRTNGTANAAGYQNTEGLLNWAKSQSGIVDVAINDFSIAMLRQDGTVAIKYTYDFYDRDYGFSVVKEWTDIVAIDAGDYHLVGLKSDGTVVAAGKDSNKAIQVNGWRNVSKIFAKRNTTVAIKNDGSLYVAGDIDNYNQIRNLKNVTAVDMYSNTLVATMADGTSSMVTENVWFVGDELYDSDIHSYRDEITKKNVTADVVFKALGYDTKIVFATKFYDSFGFYSIDTLVLDDAGNLYGMNINTNNQEIEKLESNIESVILTDSNTYYAVDKNGQILSNKEAFTAEDWILTTNITYNGEKVNSDVPPYVKNDRTLAPMRAILEALGMTVTWDQSTLTATATKDGITVSVTINSNKAYVNGVEKLLDVPAEVTNNRTFVPVRFFAEALNMNVDWDGYTKTVIIESK